MDSTAFTLPENYRQILNIVQWAVVALGGLWLVTGVLGYMHRRAYNLTHAESGSSQNIKPDFLKVDKAGRQAAIQRGEAFDKKLAEAAAPAPPTETVRHWAQIMATVTSVIGLVAGILGALRSAESVQLGAERLGSFEKLGMIFSQYPFGATIAVIIVAWNLIQFFGLHKKK